LAGSVSSRLAYTRVKLRTMLKILLHLSKGNHRDGERKNQSMNVGHEK
jgi:hypothetical protein